MRRRDYKRAVVLVCFLLLQAESMAAVAPAFNGKMGGAVGGVIGQKLSGWGFAANDPRFGATMSGVGAGALALVAGGVGVATGAATWPAVLAMAGATALASGAISLAQDGLTKWLYNPDGTVSTQGSGAAGSGPVMVPGGYYFETGYAGKTWRGGSGGGVIESYVRARYGTTVTWSADGSNLSGDYYVVYGSNGERLEVGMASRFSGATTGCPAGQVYTIPPGSCGAVPGMTNGDLDHVSVPDAIDALPDSDAAKPISDEALALAANALWKAMLANTPSAVPWSASDPITPADAGRWKSSNPDAVPSAGDGLAPVSAPGGSAVPISPASPGASPAPAPGPQPTPGHGQPTDLGPDPNVGAPNLEAIPTAQSILDPILHLMPDLKAFSVPAHAGTCPKPSFDALGKTYVIDSHCVLLESNRALLEAAMMLCWTLASVFIVLRA